MAHLANANELSGELLGEVDASGARQADYSFGPFGLVQRYKVVNGDYTSYTWDPLGNLVSRHRQPSSLPDTIAVYDSLGGAQSDLSTGSGLPYPANDPIGAGSQRGVLTDESLKGTANGLPLSGSRFYDPQLGRFLSLEDRFGPLTTPLENPDGGYQAFIDNNYQWVQAVGEIASFAPGVGAAVNLANGALDVREGQYLSGGLNIVFGVAEVGGIARAGAEAVKGAAAFEQMGVRTAETVGEGGARRSSSEALAQEAGASSKAATGPSCFVADTPVVMGDGSTKPIQLVKAKDPVLSRDQVTGEVSVKPVTRVFVHQADATLVLHFSNGEAIECTSEHPFYVEGQGFKAAKELGIGTSIVTRAGPSTQVVQVERHDKPVTVYNFEVESTHTYFVGNSGLWVHNNNNCINFPENVRYRARSRSYGVPRNPNPPTHSQFNPRIYSVQAGELDSRIVSRAHGINPEQAHSIGAMSNEELVRFRVDDPISSYGARDGFNLTGGHHRTATIIDRVNSGRMSPETLVKILIHD